MRPQLDALAHAYIYVQVLLVLLFKFTEGLMVGMIDEALGICTGPRLHLRAGDCLLIGNDAVSVLFW